MCNKFLLHCTHLSALIVALLMALLGSSCAPVGMQISGLHSGRLQHLRTGDAASADAEDSYRVAQASLWQVDGDPDALKKRDEQAGQLQQPELRMLPRVPAAQPVKMPPPTRDPRSSRSV